MLVALALALAAAGPPVIEAITDAEDAPGVRAVFDVDTDADVVLELLWDVARFKTVFPDIQELAVMKRPDDSTVEVRFVVDAVIAKPNYTLRRKIDRVARRISWVSIAGDLKKIVGHWHITPLIVADGVRPRCRVSYQTVVDVGVPGASSIYRSVVMGKVEQVIERVRQASALAAQTAAAKPTTTPTTTTLPAPTTTTTSALAAPSTGP